MTRLIPAHWETALLEDLTTKIGSGATPRGGKFAYKTTGTPLIRSMNIHFHGFVEDGLVLLDDKQAEKLKSVIVEADDVLLNITGASIGRVTTAPSEMEGARVNQHVSIIRSNGGFQPRFLSHYLASSEMQREIMETQSGATRQALTKAKIGNFQIPLPPLNEQRRIADKIDALQAKSRRTREALEAVGPLLEKLRRSMLAAAFRGDLTAEWRNQHPDVEPGEKLLERIRTERRARWEEAELAKMRAKGIKPTDDKWKAKYSEPANSDGPEAQHVSSFVDTKQLGWSDCPLLGVCDDHRGIPYGIVQTGEPVDGGVPTVRCGDIEGYSVDLAGLKLVDPNISAGYERTLLTGGEVLIAIRGSVGEATVATADMAGMNISREVAMIPVLSGINPRYVMYLLSSPVGQRLLMDKVKGVAQQGINLADLRQFPVPLPCADEQQTIVDLLDGAMARIDAIQAQVEGSKADTFRSDQSILAKAFRGELVPQDPNDEPASVLLERIKAEREAGTGKKRTRKKTE